VPKNREYVAKHARLIGQMMEPELAGDEIETLRPKLVRVPPRNAGGSLRGTGGLTTYKNHSSEEK